MKVNIDTGILLSGGIDSAILASFLPKGAKAYTIVYDSEGAIDESDQASIYANILDLDHNIVTVTWEDHISDMKFLMENKKAPLHAIEVGLYRASVLAKKQGINKLIVGNGADSTFGGMDKLLAKDWKYHEFINRYTFVDPKEVLIDHTSFNDIYLEYKINDSINVQKFLKTVHGIGIIQTFENAIRSANCEIIAPFEKMEYPYDLDIERIRGGESKYILRSVFKRIFPDLDIPEKIPFARPMDKWLKNWSNPKRQEFKKDINIDLFTGDQKWLIFCLEMFLNTLDELIS